jgi:membrane associated rhomboid family serine protease
MFPLRAVHKTARPPFVTRILIVLNVLLFLGEYLPGSWGDGIRAWARSGAVQPQCYSSPSSCGIELPQEVRLLWQPLFVSMFLHAGVLHLALNMLFLSVFGAGVEEKLGKIRFVLLYFLCGIAAALAFIVTHAFSDVALVGASGAIAGVLGAYLILLPREWILTYVPPVFFFPVPAPLFLLVWIVLQIVSQFSQVFARVLFLPNTGAQDVAWIAHIGGFVVGVGWGWMTKPWWKRRQ